MIESTEDNPTQPISNETGDVSQTTLQSIHLNNNEESGKHDNVDGTGNEEKPDDKCSETLNNLEVDKSSCESNQALESLSQLEASHTGFLNFLNQIFSEQVEKFKEERDRVADVLSKLHDKIQSLNASVTNLELLIEQTHKEKSAASNEAKKQLERVEETLKDDVTIDKSTDEENFRMEKDGKMNLDV